MNILSGNNKTVVWSAACPISDLFGKGEPILGSAYTSPNIGSSLPDKSSRVVCVGLLNLSPETVPNVSVYRPDSLFQEQLGVQRSYPCRS